MENSKLEEKLEKTHGMKDEYVRELKRNVKVVNEFYKENVFTVVGSIFGGGLIILGLLVSPIVYSSAILEPVPETIIRTIYDSYSKNTSRPPSIN